MKQLTKVSLPDGQETISLAPTVEGQLAICNLSVLQRLAGMLGKANFNAIREQLIMKIEKIDDNPDSGPLTALINVVEDEIAFHKTVNLLNTITAEDLAVIA